MPRIGVREIQAIDHETEDLPKNIDILSAKSRRIHSILDISANTRNVSQFQPLDCF